MPFPNLFKKLSKAEPKKEPIKDDPFRSPEIQKKRYDQNSKPGPRMTTENDPMYGLLNSIAQNSLDGRGERLVLGEGMTPMSEALQHGGRYILVHPEVIRKLESNGIDSFLIYEAGLKSELVSRIPRIDFVGGSVAELLQQAQGKPERQLPVHVRQILWLKENAGNYGYRQSGNSWKLE